MHDIGVRIKLDTGDLVSGAGTARRNITDLIDKIRELRKEGKHEEAFQLELAGSRLQRETPGFEKDIKTLANDPRHQTTLPDGGTVLKVDPEYASVIKSNNEAMERLGDKFHEATRAGGIEKIRELIPQIEKQQSESHKTIKDIINTNGEFPHSPPLDNDTPDGGQKNPRAPSLPKNDDWRELKGLSGAISQAHDSGDWERVSKLGNAKDALRGIMGEYDRDGKLEAKIKADPEFASQLKEIRDALKGTIAAIDEAAANGEYEKAEQLTGQAKQLQGISHKTVQEAAALPDSKMARDAALSSFLNVQTAQQIVGSVTSGINTYVAHLDRSSIVNALGGGDVMGAQIDELHRSAAEKSALWGSVGRIGGGILGALGGLALAPFTGGASLFSTGAMVAGGAAFGSTLFGAGGELVGTLGDEKKANEMATGEAYAKLWERQAPAAMELTALLGKYGGSDAANTKALRRTFEIAANTATEYGYSPEEGMEQVKQAAYQGLNEGQSLEAARDVFAFERGTGADRGALSEFRSRTERFGVPGGLNTAYQGLQASGMAPAQFNEFLRAMQKSFEDGISKGFVRGADEIAGNLSFLSNLNGGSELWKGEQGANRLSQMNAGIEATTALSSVSDILSFRGAQNVLNRWDAQGDAKERWKAIGDLDPTKDGLELRRGYDYIDAMAILERGLTPELFHSQMQMIEGVEGKGNRTGAVEQMKSVYGLNYTGSAALYQSYQDKLDSFGGDMEEAEKYFSGDEWARTLENFKANPDYNNSTELAMFKNVAKIEQYTAQIGQWELDKKMPEIANALKKAWEDAYKKGVTKDPPPGDEDDPTASTPNPFPSEPTVEEARTNFEEAVRNGVPGDEVDARRIYSDSMEREMQRQDMLIDITRKTKGATKRLFSEGLFGGESAQMNAINDTVITASQSGDPSQFSAAQEVSEALIRYAKENGVFDSKKYDKNNTFNSLAEFSGDMIGMLNALRGITKEIESAAERINKLEATLELD
ncbi:MAG: hypothetical protein LBK73_08760 [Treponema sp.]|jgi:hypothetical protein|nr:hypothetical protein [Treponema sp.]